MCFTKERSALYGAIGLTIATVVLFLWRRLHGRILLGPRTQPTGYIAVPIAYFAAMEFIQVAQHSVVATSLDDPQCNTWANQILTMVGAMHVAFQPLALHFGFGGHYKAFLPSSYPMIVRVVALGCVIDAVMMLLGQNLRGDYDFSTCGAYQWTVGNKLCTYKGTHHLAWSIPFPKPSYYYHGALHSFCFFGPFLVIGRASHVCRGVLLFLTGPALAEYLTGWLPHESGSVWCYAFLFNNLSCYIHGLIFDVIDLVTGAWKTRPEWKEHAEGWEMNSCIHNGRVITNGHGKLSNGYAKQNGHAEHVSEVGEVNNPPLILDWLRSGKAKTS